MEKKVILFKSINLYLIFFILLVNLCSCSSDSVCKEISVIQVSGIVYQKQGNEKKALKPASMLLESSSNSKIEFESGFAIFQLDTLQIILPKGTKRSYSITEILDEFDNKDGNINARYAKYVSAKLLINHGKTQEDQTTKGVVSRGSTFLYSINPSKSCSLLRDSICFSWDTNLLLDTLKIHVIDKQQKTVGTSLSLPENLSKQIAKKDVGINSGGRYYWQITRAYDAPNYNAWKAFDVAFQNEITELNNFYLSDLSLSEDTRKSVTESLSCGCGL